MTTSTAAIPGKVTAATPPAQIFMCGVPLATPKRSMTSHGHWSLKAYLHMLSCARCSHLATDVQARSTHSVARA
eukprot:10949968-Alexandrium_andersonii.AAC.1